MPRRLTPYACGEYYHIYNRGTQRASLFFTPSHYHVFITLMQAYALETCVDVVAMCLMPNHYHLIVTQREEGDISAFMQKLGYTFSKRMNRELRRTGTCFEGRYKSKHCNTAEYLAQLAVYIHANPVVSGLVEHASDWEYSDFQEYIGIRTSIQTHRDPVKSLFKSSSHYEGAVIEYVRKKKKLNLTLQADLADINK